jgi:hypothetical protein
VIVTLVALETRCALMVNVADVVPAVTVTQEGTVATDVLLLLSVTVVADVGAALSVTMPRELEPPLTLAGLSVSEISVTPVGAVTVSVAPSVAPYVAEIVTF